MVQTLEREPRVERQLPVPEPALPSDPELTTVIAQRAPTVAGAPALLVEHVTKKFVVGRKK